MDAGRPLRFSADDFARRAAGRLRIGEEVAVVGDHVFNPDLADRLLAADRRPAAVLVPVIRREPEATLLFTLRTSGLRAHAGQISFPGGRIDPEDAGPEAAALREAEEEIGLERSFVDVVGRGPDYLTGSGYHVALILATVRSGFSLTLNPAEVEDAFEAPLSFFMDPANHRTGSRIWNGARRCFFEMPFQDRHVWGITAGIVRILYERLYAEPAADEAARSPEGIDGAFP